MKKLLLLLALCVVGPLWAESPEAQYDSRASMLAQLADEKPGDYFIARRYYKIDYKFWGYIRRPGESWKNARMVMLNENKCPAPDRKAGILGSDNGYEYILKGYFSGDTVYEPASNGFYPEFVLTSATLRNKRPGPIFKPLLPAIDPNRRVIMMPY